MAKLLYAPTEDVIKLKHGVLGTDAAAGSDVSLNLGSNSGSLRTTSWSSATRAANWPSCSRSMRP